MSDQMKMKEVIEYKKKLRDVIEKEINEFESITCTEVTDIRIDRFHKMDGNTLGYIHLVVEVMG